jgi:hypothetical protein
MIVVKSFFTVGQGPVSTWYGGNACRSSKVKTDKLYCKCCIHLLVKAPVSSRECGRKLKVHSTLGLLKVYCKPTPCFLVSCVKCVLGETALPVIINLG